MKTADLKPGTAYATYWSWGAGRATGRNLTSSPVILLSTASYGYAVRTGNTWSMMVASAMAKRYTAGRRRSSGSSGVVCLTLPSKLNEAYYRASREGTEVDEAVLALVASVAKEATEQLTNPETTDPERVTVTLPDGYALTHLNVRAIAGEYLPLLTEQERQDQVRDQRRAQEIALREQRRHDLRAALDRVSPGHAVAAYPTDKTRAELPTEQLIEWLNELADLRAARNGEAGQ